MITLDNADDIYEWDTEKLYNAVQSISDADEGIMQQVEQGLNIKFPIDYITQEWYEVYPTSRKAKIYGFGKISLQDFLEEKKARDRLMRQLIEEEIDKPGTTIPRT